MYQKKSNIIDQIFKDLKQHNLVVDPKKFKEHLNNGFDTYGFRKGFRYLCEFLDVDQPESEFPTYFDFIKRIDDSYFGVSYNAPPDQFFEKFRRDPNALLDFYDNYAEDIMFSVYADVSGTNTLSVAVLLMSNEEVNPGRGDPFMEIFESIRNYHGDANDLEIVKNVKKALSRIFLEKTIKTFEKYITDEVDRQYEDLIENGCVTEYHSKQLCLDNEIRKKRLQGL